MIHSHPLGFHQQHSLCSAAPAASSPNSVFLSHRSSTSFQPPASQQYFSLTPLQPPAPAGVSLSVHPRQICRSMTILEEMQRPPGAVRAGDCQMILAGKALTACMSALRSRCGHRRPPVSYIFCCRVPTYYHLRVRGDR